MSEILKTDNARLMKTNIFVKYIDVEIKDIFCLKGLTPLPPSIHSNTVMK